MIRQPSLEICNIALAEARGQQIASTDEDTPEGRACRLHYDNCLQTLLEAHEWGFATRRVTLAAGSNDRSGEWSYAYATPVDMAQTAMLVYPYQTPLSGVYFPWPYDFPRPPFYFTTWQFDNGVIYSNLETPILQYISRDVDETAMPQAFKRAVALDLASRLAITLWNDRAMKGDLMQEAELMRRRAMADDLNRYPRRDTPDLDEVGRVRA